MVYKILQNKKAKTHNIIYTVTAALSQLHSQGEQLLRCGVPVYKAHDRQCGDMTAREQDSGMGIGWLDRQNSSLVGTQLGWDCSVGIGQWTG